ncbi:hypothetical protein MJD09_20315 [bacterium]|nr:hypothetical protein [bacterium]
MLPRSFRFVLQSLCLLHVFSQYALSTERTMPVSEIKPGMRGIGKTVFAGTEIEDFEFEVLDIMPNFRAKRDLILVKLIGEKVEHTGVVAGMSGSPTYIDGKLIGALAYRFGLFSKEPIAGITPIAQMFEIIDQEKVRNEELAANRGFRPEFLEMAVGVRDFSWGSLAPPQLQKSRASYAHVSGLVPVETPLLFSGFENSALELSAKLFDGMGFKIQSAGGGTSIEKADIGTLEPGSAFSAVIVDGDFGWQAAGTVTYRDGDKILGLGHPFLNFGAVEMPLGQAKVLTTLSSLMSSTKMAALMQIIGTIHQDRTTGLLGVSGETPSLIPFKVSFIRPFQEPIEFNFRVAEDRSLSSITPIVVGIVLSNSIESARLSNSNQTLQLNGKVHLKDHSPVIIQNYYAGSVPSALVTDAMEAVGEVSSTLGALLTNSFVSPDIESVELDFTAHPKKYLANVQRVEVDKATVRPGDEITLFVYLKEYQGKEHRVQHKLTIPNEVSGRRISVYVGSGSRLSQLEFRTSPQKFRPKSFQQLVTLLEKRRRNNLLFFQVRERDQGVLLSGQELPSLPPSVRSVLNSQKKSGDLVSLRDRRLIEESVQVDYSISGGRTILLDIKHRR